MRDKERVGNPVHPKGRSFSIESSSCDLKVIVLFSAVIKIDAAPENFCSQIARVRSARSPTPDFSRCWKRGPQLVCAKPKALIVLIHLMLTSRREWNLRWER